MTMVTTPISARTLPRELAPTAGGGYTLPRFAFIPHPSLQVLSSGFVPGPTFGGVTADFAAPPQMQRPYPLPIQSGLYGVRAVTVKSSPM